MHKLQSMKCLPCRDCKRARLSACLGSAIELLKWHDKKRLLSLNSITNWIQTVPKFVMHRLGIGLATDIDFIHNKLFQL